MLEKCLIFSNLGQVPEPEIAKRDGIIVIGLDKWFMCGAKPPKSYWLPCCGRVGPGDNTVFSVESNRLVLNFQLCHFLAAGPSPAAVGPEGRIQVMAHIPDVKTF